MQFDFIILNKVMIASKNSLSFLMKSHPYSHCRNPVYMTQWTYNSNQVLKCQALCDQLNVTFGLPLLVCIKIGRGYRQQNIMIQLGYKGVSQQMARGLNGCCDVIHQWRQTWDTLRWRRWTSIFMVVSESEVRIGTEHGVNMHIIGREHATIINLPNSICTDKYTGNFL